VAFDELELKRIDKTVGEFCRRRTNSLYADKLRFVYEVDGHAVSIYEERPPWDGVGEWTRMGVARFRFVRTRGEWRLYWMRRDLKWHPYEPDAATTDLAAFVKVVETDKYGAFFG